MIKVLIVEDSPVARELLTYILNNDENIEVIGTAEDGEKALEILKWKKPDLITMDIFMPKMDGFETTRRIMEETPTPIVIVSASYKPDEVELSFKAIDAGAVAIEEKPRGIGHQDFERISKRLIQTVKSMSEIRVIKRRPRQPIPVTPAPQQKKSPIEYQLKNETIKAVVIGTSTGGPPVIKTILVGLKQKFDIPILVVQHITSGFISGMTHWIQSTTGFNVNIPKGGEKIKKGNVYFAPDRVQMGIGENDTIQLKNDPPENGFVPSVDYLFRSAANHYGKNTIGILLTGMGTDGASGLKQIKEKGGTTIVQDKESSVVHGMPGEAIRIGASDMILSPHEIIETLLKLTQN